jgi:hypothetical protein
MPMELLLTQADLDRMPAALRDQLFVHLAGVHGPGEHGREAGTQLDREQATALLREVSFHPAGDSLWPLLEHLASGKGARPPTRERLMEALKEDSPQLGRHLASLDRLTAKVIGRPGVRLCAHDRTDDSYAMHAATRQLVRELLATMNASGRKEEPLWE